MAYYETFSEYGVYEFVICGGYRVDLIKEYFMDFYIYQSDITVDLQSNAIEIHKKKRRIGRLRWWTLACFLPQGEE
ncbi:hypothetical protein C823_003034 [Eubacterium plexicaudatum ASF492]|nr:hypothetical protein C823_003034 [Eubacterium plexicaudatum ASF492]